MLRIMVGASNNVQQDVILAELGIQTFWHHWLDRVVTFWNSLVQVPVTHMYASILKDSRGI